KTLKDISGGTFVGDGLTLRIGGRLVIDLKNARLWSPPTIALTASQQEWNAAVHALSTIMRQRGTSDPTQERMANSLAALSGAWQYGDDQEAAVAAASLLGLGPGLTPSGDDL